MLQRLNARRTAQRELAQVELDSGLEMLRQTGAQLELARQRLAKTEFRAPIGGTVTALFIKVGETAVPSAMSIAGSDLMVVANTSSLNAEINVDETDVARVSVGQRARIVPAAFPDKGWSGIVERVARFVTEGSWLDVGFGNGSLLFTAQEWGFRPLGLDLRPASVEALQRLGIEARAADLTTLDEPGRFAVISLADVLEHMPFPRDGLVAAHRLLQPDGVLFVSMPNYDCMAWRLLDAGNANPYWGELEHFHNFSRARLETVLREQGFEPLHYAVSERYRVCMEVIARRV